MNDIVERTTPKKKAGRPKKTNAFGKKVEKEPDFSAKPEEKAPEVPESNYEISITIGDTTITGKGATAHEALASIQKPEKITTKVFVSITDGDKVSKTMFMPLNAKRLFFPQAQYIQARNLLFLLK